MLPKCHVWPKESQCNDVISRRDGAMMHTHKQHYLLSAIMQQAYAMCKKTKGVKRGIGALHAMGI